MAASVGDFGSFDYKILKLNEEAPEISS